MLLELSCGGPGWKLWLRESWFERSRRVREAGASQLIKEFKKLCRTGVRGNELGWHGVHGGPILLRVPAAPNASGDRGPNVFSGMVQQFGTREA